MQALVSLSLRVKLAAEPRTSAGGAGQKERSFLAHSIEIAIFEGGELRRA